MATIAEIRQGVHMRHAYLLLIQGVPFAFTDEPALAAAGWWTLDGRVLKLGLSVPETLKISIEIESGMFEEDQAVFRLLDIDGTIPGFFGGISKTYQQLGERITPLDDPAPANPIDSDGGGIDLDDGGYLGTEAIGPAQERDYFSATPNWAPMPGQDHPAFDDPLPVFTSPAVGPLLIEGRRVALYRLVYDEDTGTWPTFEVQTDAALAGGWSPALWWGTLRQAGRVEGRIWSIACTGPGSWLRRALNSRTTTLWYPVTADFLLAENEEHIGVEMEKRYYVDGSHHVCGSGYSYVADPSSKANLVASIQAALAAVAALAGPDGTWNADPGIGAGSITFGLTSVTIASTVVGGDYAMFARLIMSRKCWRALGYDPEASFGSDDGPQPRFTGASLGMAAANPDLFVDPPPPYYTAVFTTVPFGEDPLGFSGNADWAGTDGAKIYVPLYAGGVTVLKGDGDQVVHLTPPDNERIYCESQTIRAHESTAEINGNPCNAARLWCFRGKLQLPRQPTDTEQPEPIDTVQVARCLWVDIEGGVVAVDETGIARGLYIEEWLDPRLFGFNYEPIDPALGWASNDGGEQIEASPLALFGAYHRRPDRVDHTILRVLLSTGAAAWDGGIADDGDGTAPALAASFLTEGTNGVGESWPCGDFEIYDMGLQVPAGMIDHEAILAAAADLPSGEGGPLAVGKVAVQGGPLQSEELFESLFAPRGWAWQLKRGRLGIWAPYQSAEGKYQEGIDFVISEADLHGTAGDPGSVIPGVELRPVNPFDRVSFNYTGQPTETWTEGQELLKLRARDLGARARSGSRLRDVSAPDLLATAWFAAGDKTNPNNADTDEISAWTGAVNEIWERRLPTWLAQPHRLVTGLRIKRTKGQDIYPGAILRLTNPWPANSVGTYGVTGQYCRVISVMHETDSCACVVDALVEARPPNVLKWAPLLRVVDDATELSDRYNSGTRTFYVQAWGGTEPPLAAFIKPVDLDVADAPAKVLGLQYNGVTWMLAFSFLVSSVNAGARSITHTAAGLTGTYLDRKYTVLVLAPASDVDQVEWTRVLFAQHTELPPTVVTGKLPKS